MNDQPAEKHGEIMNEWHTRSDKSVSLDVVIPFYNEETVIPLLIDRLDATFSAEQCKKYGIEDVSFIFVDDGSLDRSVAFLRERLEAKSHYKSRILRLSRNFGHQAAVTAGINNSTSDLVAVIDADLQDPPELVIDMINKWREGYDVIYAQRINRKDNPFKKFLYWGFYRLYHILSPIDIALDSGDFCLMSRQVVDELRKLPESVRFPRGLRSWVGFKQTGIEYDRPERAAGITKYSLRRLYKLATDGITSISIRPLKVAQLLALAYLFISICTFGFVLTNISRSNYGDQSFLVLLSVILFSNSLVLFCLYILGAYIGRAYLEAKRRPAYIIMDIINGGSGTGNG